MKENILELNSLTDSFLGKKLNATEFEKAFAAIFDFEEIDAPANLLDYFTLIRELLERVTIDKEDLEKHPDYYINEQQLREDIIKLKGKYSENLRS